MPPAPKQTVSLSRSAAFDILVRVERDDAYANELLHSHMLDKLSAQDRGLCMEIVMGVLRWRSRLDTAIAQFSFTPFHRLDFEVLTALRIGAYQLQFLTGIPSRAAVNESVNLVKRAKKTSAAPMVNVILRKIGGLPPATASTLTDACGASPASLARHYAHPQWMVDRWAGEYGADAAARICAFDQQVPATALRLRTEESALARDDVVLAPGQAVASGAHRCYVAT